MAGFGRGLQIRLIYVLQNVYFAIVIDETTDISIMGQLAVMVMYWCPRKHEIVVDLLDFVECTDGTATGLTSAILNLLDELKIPRERYGFLGLLCEIVGQSSKLDIFFQIYWILR